MHYRALKIVYQDKKPNLKNLLHKDRAVSIHLKNLQDLATEFYIVKNGLFSIIMNEVSTFQDNKICELRSGIHLANRNMHVLALIVYLI